MPIYNCLNKCCDLNVEPYTHPIYNISRRRKKAGVFIYDPSTDRVLIVQSRGQLWGLPKGTLNIGETERHCAIRETKEETGLKISDDQFSRAMKVKNRAIYFYLEMEYCKVNVQSHIPDNDVNGVSWIKVSCLNELLKNGNIEVNRHCRMAFQRFLNITLQESPVFEVVKKSK